MYPILFKLGPFVIHTYGLFIALGFLAAIILAGNKAQEFNLDRELVFDLSFWVLLSALAGARILEVLTNLSYYRLDLWRIVKIWGGGLSYFGGLAGGVLGGIFYVKHKKLSVWHIGDLMAPFISLGQAIGRIGCFFAGCCYGKVCNAPWAVHFDNPQSLAPTGIALHPTQIYEALADFMVFLILLNVGKRREFKGQVFLLYFILYAAVRLMVEFYRGDNPAVWLGFTLYQLISAGVLVLAMTIYIMRWRQKRKRP